MSNDINELLKQWGKNKQHEEVPEFFSEGIDDILSSLPDRQTRHKVKPSIKKRVLFSVGAIAAAFFLVIGSGFVSPTMAAVLSEIPVVGSFFEKSADPILVEMNKKGLVSSVQKSATDKGIMLTFTDMFYDGTKLALAYNLEMPSDLPSHESPFEFQALLNNKEFNFISEAEEKLDSDGQYKGIISMEVFDGTNLQEQLSLNLKVTKVHGQPGKWNFNLPIKMKNVAAKSAKFSPMTAVDWQEVKAVVEEVRFTPASSVINIKVKAPKKEINDIDFMIYDENKTLLGGMSGFGGAIKELKDGKASMTRNIILPPMKSIPEKLNIELFKIKDLSEKDYTPKEHKFTLTNDIFPITIPYNDQNEIIITGIEYRKDRTLLKFDIKGEPILQANFVQLANEKGSVEIIHYNPIRLSDKSMSFAWEYEPVNPNSNLILKSYVEEDWSRESKFLEVKLQK
ncbi:DUF4179 domain-containing protein [Neobacillus drentensis]|uniref:DUF4179 domain-containing protein n=1 Tax=Neobacillus drentensis TaxID=220684 RepID=UPI002FFD5816